MALSVFDDKTVRPTDRAIARTLGKTAALWRRVREHLVGNSDALVEEWAFSGPKFGWSLRVKRGKRIVVYLTPCEDYFLASFALGEKACAEARGAGLSAAVMALIVNAPKYAEGRGVRIPVRSRKDADCVQKLAAIKLAH